MNNPKELLGKIGVSAIICLAIAIAFFKPLPTYAATKTASVSGNWSNTATWGGAAVPVAGDNIVINSGVIVTVNVNTAAVTTIAINAPTANNGITISGTNTLNATGAITMTAPTSNFNDTISVGTGTLNAASITIGGGTAASRYCLLSVSTGTINVNGNIAFSGTAAQARLTFTGAGTLNIGGNLGSGGTFTAGTGTVNFNGSSASTADGYTYNVLKSNNTAGVSPTAAITVTTLTIGDVTAGSVFSDGGFAITPGGSSVLNLTNGIYKLGSAGTATTWPAWGTRNIAAGTTVEYAAGVAQTVSVTPSYQNLAYTGADTKNVAAGGTLSVAGNWAASSTATLTTTANATVTGNISGNGGITVGSGTISLGGNWANSGAFTAGTGTVNYNKSTGGQSVRGMTYNNLTSSNTSGIQTASGAMTVNGTLTTAAGGTLNLATNALSGTLGTITNNGTIRTQNTSVAPIPTGKTWGGTVQYDATTGGQTVMAGTYNNLIVNHSVSGSSSVSGNVIVGGILTLTKGALSTGANNVYVNSTGSVSRTTGYINGFLKKYVATGATAPNFEIGDSSNYTPVNIQFGNVSVSGDLTFNTTAGDHPNIGTSTIDSSKSVNRYWTAANSGITFNNFSAIFNFINPGDIDAGANTAAFIVGKYTGGTWSYPTVGTKNSNNTQTTGLTSFSDFQIGNLVDTTPPSGGSITYTDGYYASLSVPITYNIGTDSGSGMNNASGKIQRASATLSGGVCGVFGGFSDLVTEFDGSYTDTSVTSGNCYKYQYVISDNAANTATYTSANVAKVDNASPTGGSITYTNGYYSSLSVPITYTLGSDGVSGLNNASGKIQRASATLTGVTCGGFGGFTDLVTEFDGSYTDVSVVTGNCYKYQYVIADNAGNPATYTSANVAKVDTTAPTLSEVTPVPTPANNTTPSYSFSSNEAGGILYGGDCTSTSYTAIAGSNTVSFNTLSAGTHSNCTVKVRDAAGNQSSTLNVSSFFIDLTNPVVAITAPTHVSSATITNTTVHVTDNNAILATNVVVDAATTAGYASFNCSQTDSKTVDCTISITSSGTLVIKGTDSATNVGTSTESGYIIDTTPPSGGSISYTDGYYSSLSVPITYTLGTDGGSGLNTATGKIQRASATLSAGVCGSFGSFSDLVTEFDGSYTDVSVTSGNCYKYQYLISDNAANSATYTSANVAKIDTAAPTGGSISYTNGYYTSLSVPITYALGSDAISGLNNASGKIQRSSATLTAGTCGGFGGFTDLVTEFDGSYTDVSVASGNCYKYQYLISDNAGNTATYTSANAAKVDNASPTGGSISYTDGYFKTMSVAITYSLGTDGAAGLSNASGKIQRASATLTDGSCGGFGSFSDLVTEFDGSYTDTSVTTGKCYQYQYIVDDNAGNSVTYSSANVAKTDSVSPTVTITAPTKLSNVAITDTTIHITDNNAILGANVTVDGTSTAGTASLNCTQTDIKTVDCTISITSSGNLVMKATDDATNSGTDTETGYIIETTPPTITITAPTKLSNATITDTSIHVTDNNAIPASGVVVDGSSTAGTSGLNCTQTDAKTVDCTIDVTSSGNLVMKATDSATNSATQAENSYVIETVVPTIAITAPTKTSGTTVTDTTVHVTDNNAILAADVVVDGSTTAGTSGLNCSQTDVKTVDCTINITSSGNLVMNATDEATNSTTQAENGYIVDSVPPVLSAIHATPAANSATINWNTDELASSKVIYSPDTSYASTTAESDLAPRVTSHGVGLSNLVACAHYHYKVISRDAMANAVTSTDFVFTTTGCPGGAGVQSQTSQTISTGGGTLSLTFNGTLTLQAPSGYWTAPADFQIKALDGSVALGALGTPAGFSAVGNRVLDLKALLDSQTELSGFSGPITITMSYTSNEVLNIQEDTLQIFHYVGGVWVALASCTIDTTAKTVTCTTTSFSPFALFGKVKTSSGGGGGGAGMIFYPPLAIKASDGTRLPLDFSINNGATQTSDPKLNLTLNADPASVRGYAVSLNPDLKDSIMHDYTSVTTYSLPAAQGDYRIYLRYYSKTGQPSDILSHDISYRNTIQSVVTLPLATGKFIPFARNLKQGDRGADVKRLQQFLNAQGFLVAKKGAGSPGKETTTFGPALKQALIRYQEAHADMLLKPQGLKRGTGAFMSATRKYINALSK
jgi:hypothetical protein